MTWHTDSCHVNTSLFREKLSVDGILPHTWSSSETDLQEMKLVCCNSNFLGFFEPALQCAQTLVVQLQTLLHTARTHHLLNLNLHWTRTEFWPCSHSHHQISTDEVNDGVCEKSPTESCWSTPRDTLTLGKKWEGQM